MALPDHLALRAITEDETERYIRAIETFFGEDATDELVKMGLEIAEPERWYAVFHGEATVGAGSNASFSMSVPGGATIPMGAVIAVGVAATHRRQGIAAALMRTLLEDSGTRSEPVSMLTASEGTIYERFGYGPAYRLHTLEMRTDRIRFTADAEAIAALSRRTELIDAVQAKERFPAILGAAARTRPGVVLRDDAWWRATVDHDHGSSLSKRRLAVIGDRAYAMYRLKASRGDHGPDGEVHVGELAAADPQAEAAMWQFLASIDLMATITAPMRPADDPLPYRLQDTQAVREKVSDPYYLRLVDVAAALRQRGYDVADELVLGIRDSTMPANDGCWQLSTGPSGPTCTATDRPPDLSLDVSVLGSAYLGGVGVQRLTEAGLITEHTSGAAARAHRVLATRRAAWNTQDF